MTSNASKPKTSAGKTRAARAMPAQPAPAKATRANNTRLILRWSIAFVCAILFAILFYAVANDKNQTIDDTGYRLIISLKGPAMTSFMKFITEFGGAYVIIPATAILFFFVTKPRLKWAIVGNLAGILIVNQGLKFLIQRPRPDVALRLIEQGGYSFPSGHSMCSMAFYGFLIYLSFRYFTSPHIRWGTTIMLGALTLIIGISRIYLGVHYTTDVLAGFAITIAYLIAYISLVNFINLRTRHLRKAPAGRAKS